MIQRTAVRIRRFLRLEVARLRRVPEMLAVVAAAVIVIGVIKATASGADWAGILRSQAVNLVSAGILAGFAYVMFVLRFRRAQLRTYLERQRAAAPQGPQNDSELNPLSTTIVDELLDAKPPHAALIIGSADAGQAQLLSEVAERLAKKSRVPVAVSLPSIHADATVAGLARDRFVDGLVGSAGDAQSGRRLFASLVRRGRVVALVAGLDRVGQGEPLGTRRATIARLLEASLVEGIPFVAWINPDLAPSISEVAAFRTRPLPRSDLVAHTMRQLRDRELRGVEGLETTVKRAFGNGETTRDPVLLSVFADLVLRRERAGETGEAAIDALFSDPDAFRRHLSWMSEWALDCTLGDLANSSSPPSCALAAIGREAHYRQEAALRSDDAMAALDADGRRRFAGGVALLSQRGILDVMPFDDTSRVRFTHPLWLAFAGALGLRLEPASWRDLLRPDISSATLDALTGALLIFGSDVLRERSFLRVLHGLGITRPTQISLEMCLSVIAALQSRAEPLDFGPAEMEALERAWSTAGDVVKRRFVSKVNFESNTSLIEFLWSQVVPPAFAENSVNSFRVRRAICHRLGRMGTATWKCLRGPWRDVVEAASTRDLSSAMRQTNDWRDHGYPIASLGWTLPGVAHRVGADDQHDVYELLGKLRTLVADNPNSGGNGDHSPEIGLEISLAEGFKITAAEISMRAETCDERWHDEAASFLDSSKSWISKQALLQTLALVLDGAKVDRLDRLVGRPETTEQEHPFVRETAALVRRACRAGKRPATLTESDVWLEDVEALDDGGVNLSAESHRLLALSTLLINLAERPFVAWSKKEPGATESSIGARDRAFTTVELPRCFLRKGHAATMFEVKCDCSFKFCGPDSRKGVLHQQRRFSRSFLQIAQATAGSASLIRSEGGNGFAEKAFAPVWRALDEGLAKEEPHLSSPR